MAHETTSLLAEQSVIAAIIHSESVLDDVSDVLSADDFGYYPNRTIFKTALQLVHERVPVDLITLTDRLNDLGMLEEIGGFAYVSGLCNSSASLANTVDYAKIIRDKAIERGLLSCCAGISELVYGDDLIDDKLDKAQSLVMALSETKHVASIRPTPEILSEVIRKLDERVEGGGGMNGIATGVAKLDARFNGLEPEYIIIGGRPSMGKTTLGFNICLNVAYQQNRPALVFSIEMPAEKLMQRALSHIGQVPYDDIKRGLIKTEDYPKLAEATGILKTIPLDIDDSGSISVQEIRSRARKIKRERGDLGVVMVDYIQLVNQKAERRDLELSLISKGLKALTKELNCPVIALSQLNRNLEGRVNKHPTNADLRESGSLEEDADIIMFLYNDEKYNGIDSMASGLTEIITSKYRDGETGTDYVLTKLDKSSFQDYTGPDPRMAPIASKGKPLSQYDD